MNPTRARIATAALGLVALFASPSVALDCTPIATLSLDGSTVADLIGANSVPGEVACGTDYTGQDFHVYEFTLSEASLVVFGLATGGQSFGQPLPDAELFVLSNCDPSACIFTFANETGATSDPVCMAAGTYSLVVASPDAGGNKSYSTGVEVVDVCAPVDADEATWSGMKARF